MSKVIFSAAVLGVVLTTVGFAQTSGDEGESSGGDGVGTIWRPNSFGSGAANSPSVLSSGLSFGRVSPQSTDAIVTALKGSSALCGKIQPEYMVDCISDRLARIASGLPNTGEYREAKKALLTAAAKLHALAQANASSTFPKIRVQAKTDQGGVRTRPLTPVRTESLKLVKVQAAAVIAEAETVLLRSAENSQKRKVHYEKIARAVGSNKVILRSL